jgi:hypothetical protein
MSGDPRQQRSYRRRTSSLESHHEEGLHAVIFGLGSGRLKSCGISLEKLDAVPANIDVVQCDPYTDLVGNLTEDLSVRGTK